MFKNNTTPVLLIGAIVISGAQLSVSTVYADQGKVLKSTPPVGSNITTMTNGAPSDQSNSIDCSIQSHPDCQPQTEQFFTVVIGETSG